MWYTTVIRTTTRFRLYKQLGHHSINYSNVVYTLCICEYVTIHLGHGYTTTCPRSTLASNVDFYFQSPPVYLQWAAVASGGHKECKRVWEDNTTRTGISNTLWPSCTALCSHNQRKLAAPRPSNSHTNTNKI